MRRLKRYRGRWYAVWTEQGRTRRVALRTADRGAAERALADLNAAPAGDTVGAIFAAYLADLRDRDKSPARAADAWKQLAPTFAGLRPDQVTRDLCRLYARRRTRAGRKPGTIAKELGFIRAALRWQDRNTPAVVEMPPRPAPRDRWLTRDEYRRLRLAAKAEPHLYLFVVLGLATAARKQALLDLTWDRIDFGRGLIRLRTDGAGKGRATVPMTRHARRALRAMRPLATSPWVIEYGGKKVGSVKRAFAAACARAGVEDVTPHVLRHTAAVWMAEAGVPMAEIAQYLGHADDRITQRVYARFSPDYLRRAAAALG